MAAGTQLVPVASGWYLSLQVQEVALVGVELEEQALPWASQPNL